ncbi:serine hydrolase [Undibacterium sp. TS12]|uniref:serine hydrolase n=1 Tax=Undibacterium sp. TS12 TaxID=2908202 RepID=UPI001F4D19E5|nr:serine hydrolase [Undibacterium sp. TS12]MCH8619541.1 serine hydrolase [Undibacterium sp. TS12]
MKFRLLMGSLLSSLLFIPAAQADEIAANLQKTASQRASSGAVPGLVVATIVGKDQQVQGYGVLSKKMPQKPDAKTVYEIGSVSKTFTATLLADMVAQGKLKLDDSVASLLPDYSIPQYQGKSISLLDLATQTSGLPRMPGNFAPKQYDNPYADYTVANLKDFMQGYKMTRAPGSQYEYSNLGFGLLGQALATRAGMSYADLVKARITGPLGMPDTGIALTPAMQTQLAPGHDSYGGPTANWDIPTLAGAGALRSNAQDMLRYLQAHMQAAANTAAADAIPKGLRLTQQAHRTGGIAGTQIGLAWHMQVVRGQHVIFHSGMTGGYASFIGFTADGSRGVVVLANAAVTVDDVGFNGLVPPSAPVTEKEVRIAASDMSDYTGRYQLAPGAILQITAGKENLLAHITGQPQAPVFMRKKDEFFYKAVEASLHFERDANGRIKGLSLHQDGRVMPAPRIGDALPEPAARAEISLPADALKQYAGSYALAPSFKISITEDGGQLFAQASNQPRLPVFASARDEFFYKAVDAQLSFKRNAAGAVTGLVLHQNGRDIPGPRE